MLCTVCRVPPSRPLIALVDLDDTLLDYHWEEARSGLALAKHLGVDGRDEWQDAYSMAKRRERALRSYKEDPLQVRIALFAALLGIDLPQDMVVEAREVYASARQRNVRLLPGAIEVLELLHSTCDRTILCTSGVSDLQRRRAERAGILGRIDAIIVSGDAGIEKNDWRSFLGAEYNPDANYVVVSDLFEPDLRAAQSLGMFTIKVGAPHLGVDLSAATPHELWQMFSMKSLRHRMEAANGNQ